jgi:flagellar basal body-associated protein FliL
MAKKVALDTLEIEEREVPLPEKAPPVEETNGKRPGKRRFSKWLWISALALVMLMVVGGVSYWWIGTKKMPRKDVSTAALLQKGPLTAKVNDFIITLQDNQGKYLVMTCDLTFELNTGQDTAFQQNIFAVRKIIYEILKKKSIISPLEPRIRDGLKEEINKALSVLLGQDAITAIYFTKFVVL